MWSQPSALPWETAAGRCIIQSGAWNFESGGDQVAEEADKMIKRSGKLQPAG